MVNQRYQVLSYLGQGSFSQVYLTTDQAWRGNLVALKEIPTAHFSDKEYAAFNARFLQEAAFLMRLQHPGLPRVVEFFAEGSNYYLALEWVPGHTLEHEVEQRDRVAEGEILEWGLQLAEVLAYLHGQKPYPILLGDLKPSNVVIDYHGRIRVIDFGVATYAAPDQNREYALVSPGFSPPEQYENVRLDPRCDIYALGATLYWCAMGQSLERFRFEVPGLRRFRSDISSAAEALLARCLAVQREHRFQSAVAVIEAIRGVQRQLQERPAAASPSEILSALYRDRKRKFDF